MHRETPEFKRCCFCLPLRRGLIAWGYTKAAIHFMALIYLASIIYWFWFHDWRHIEATDIYIAVFAIIIICLLLDMSFNIIFIVAGHKKSDKLLKISYIYNMVWLGLVVLGCCFQLYVNIGFAYRLWSYIEYRKYILLDLLCSAGFTFSLISVQIYLILLIRSEMIKLRNQKLEIQFTNHTVSGEPQCTLHDTSYARSMLGQETSRVEIVARTRNEPRRTVARTIKIGTYMKEKGNKVKGSAA